MLHAEFRCGHFSCKRLAFKDCYLLEGVVLSCKVVITLREKLGQLARSELDRMLCGYYIIQLVARNLLAVNLYDLPQMTCCEITPPDTMTSSNFV